MSKSYLIVFHGDIRIFCEEKIIRDVTEDPCFDILPTWGICRPPTRRSIDIGDNLFFVAYYKELGQYYVKGWFEVGEKISYYNALNRFPTRRNVIISSNKKPVINTKWRYREIRDETFKMFGNGSIPDWLKQIKVSEGTFYQNPDDDHEIDNWKCRRIFSCRAANFRDCIQSNTCLKTNSSLEDYKDYIVSDQSNWIDIGKKLIQYHTFKNATGFTKSIQTPKGQHNVLRCDGYTNSFIEFLRNK